MLKDPFIVLLPNVPLEITYYTYQLPLLLFGARLSTSVKPFLNVAFLKWRHRRMDIEDSGNSVPHRLREIAFNEQVVVCLRLTVAQHTILFT
jgi:hypothetical protein